MPMRWTPENDRLLLLKLIETHGISVDANKIAAAWPRDGDKPTPRAITERFVKLRQLAGLKLSMSSTPGKARPRASNFTTPKKRKTNKDTDESDGDDHLTEDESPTKKQRSTGGRGRGSARGRGGRGGMQASGSPATRVKKEEPQQPELPADPFNSNSSDDFERHMAKATDLRERSGDNIFGNYQPTNMSVDFQGFSSSADQRTLNGFGMDNDPYFGNGFDNSFSASVQPAMGFNNALQVPIMGGTGRTEVSPGRERSSRKASVQANEGLAATLRRQKDTDEADGERSSAEDSQASEYHDLDGDYV